MRTRDYPLFAFGTALRLTLCGFLTSSCCHFWMARKPTGINSLRSDYPLIFMPIRTLLLVPCGWLNSDVRPSSSLTSPAPPASTSRGRVFHSPRRLHSHGWIFFFAHSFCPTCACFHVREHHECLRLSVITLAWAGTAEPCFLVPPGYKIPVGIGAASCDLFM